MLVSVNSPVVRLAATLVRGPLRLLARSMRAGVLPERACQRSSAMLPVRVKLVMAEEPEDRGQPAEHTEKLPALRPLVNLACLDTLDFNFRIGDSKAVTFFFSTNIVGAL